ncbi:Glycosyltransferase involved in cell wall bisynthesis [Flavobacterium resistens]|uniref:Glycosyltransferase n=1 Tax=Flavobacterium resistens TaxID=443612 RepID=A0A521ERT2_9FLAO|nr:glycosyltransferase family 4 protein [Flavobacterium resistens]MRX67931.1 glycosyltransferase [Flavobacterium resistens]SMO86639.1 Glycosyltransferase involved in cell wall bisynthesis [Flavobacterium resistens]
MKIAYILPKLANQGPVIVAKDIIENIKENVDLIDVYYFDDVREVDFDCNTYRIGLFDKIDFSKYDIVHSHMLRPDFYVWFHRKKSNNKTIFISTLHQNIYDNLKGNYNPFIAYFFEKIWLFLLKKQDYVITLTNEMKAIYAKKTKLNLQTIYNGRNCQNKIDENIYIDEKDTLEQIKSKYKVIGSHCLLTKRKGIHQIVESLTLLEDYALIIVGDGQEKENLLNLAKKLGVEERCYFLGYKSNATVYLNYFDVYVMSSYSEGFPLGLLEAGLMKLPVVCSDIPIFRELFTDKEVCFFKLENIQSLAKAISECYENKETLANSIYSLIQEEYSVNKMGQNYMNLYKKIH